MGIITYIKTQNKVATSRKVIVGYDHAEQDWPSSKMEWNITTVNHPGLGEDNGDHGKFDSLLYKFVSDLEESNISQAIFVRTPFIEPRSPVNETLPATFRWEGND